MRITVLNSFYVRKALSKTLSTSICTSAISKTEVVKFNDTTRRDEIKEVRVLFEKDQVLQSANLYRIGVFQCISFLLDEFDRSDRFSGGLCFISRQTVKKSSHQIASSMEYS